MGERLLQTSFNAGEFSPLARDRTDLAAYFQGAEILENLIPLVEGAARRRSGTRFVAELKNSANAARLIGFGKSSEDTILIEAGPAYFRYFDGAAMTAIESGGSPLETVTPYDAAALPFLYWSQGADVMFITTTLATIAPRALRRFSDTSWSLVLYDVKAGPFLARNESGLTLTASAVSGAITITASSALFAAGHVGARLRLWEPGLGVPYEKWLPEKAVAADDLREYSGNIYKSHNTDTTSNQPPVHEDGLVEDRKPTGGNVVVWEYLHDLSGSAKITLFNSETSVNATVEERLPHSSPEAIAATKNWALGAFSDVEGWPRLVGLYEGRLFFVSTLSQPDTIFLSRIEGFNAASVDFKQSRGNDTVEDDHAIVRTLNDNEVNIPAFAVVHEQLTLGTARGLLRIAGPSVDEPMTPAGATSRRIPGTKPAGPLRPVIADDALLYGSVGGRRIYEYLQGNPVRTLNARASHVGLSPIVRQAWCGEPWSRLFVLCADGRLWVCVYERAESVIAWARVRIGGSYLGGPAVVEEILSLKDGAGEDRLILIVKRTIGGATRRTIERLREDFQSERDLQDEAGFSDCSTRFNFWNATATTVTVAAAPGASAGAAATLAASSGTPFFGKEGAEFRVRKVSVPPRADDAAGVLSMTIGTVTGGGTGASATLLTDPDEEERLINSPLTQWGFPTDQLTGLSLWEGEEFAVQADGMDFGKFTVAGGAIALDEKVMRAYVGYEAPFRGRSLPLLRQIEGGTSRGKKLAMRRAVASVYETGDGTASIRAIVDGEDMAGAILLGRQEDDLVGAAPPLRTMIDAVDLTTFAGDEVQIEVYGAGVLPATLRSISVDYENEA